MSFNHRNAIDFGYVLLEFYKKLGISSDELAVILMIDHLNSQNNGLISSSMIASRTTIEEKEIDAILLNLYKRQYIDYVLEGASPSVSLNPLKAKLYKEFEKSLFSAEELNQNKEKEEMRTAIYERLEKLFNRSLNPFEINRIDDWVTEVSNSDIIFNAIKDAEETKIYNINQIDRLIVKKMRQEDNQGNETNWEVYSHSKLLR